VKVADVQRELDDEKGKAARLRAYLDNEIKLLKSEVCVCACVCVCVCMNVYI
jgi:hypothetical protein